MGCFVVVGGGSYSVSRAIMEEVLSPIFGERWPLAYFVFPSRYFGFWGGSGGK